MANLAGVDLSFADLTAATLAGANLAGTDFDETTLHETVFANVNLSSAKGLDTCTHRGPSTIDHRTLKSSGELPLSFLRGCGLPDVWIEYLPSLVGKPIEFYSCFISYSSKDQSFSERLHADLQNKGARCWFAPEDMKIGDEIEPTIDMAIRLRDKLLLILSQESIESGWVEREVRKALQEEERRGTTVLFPVRLDDAVMESPYEWAHMIRRKRHIGDFRQWKDHDTYQTSFERLLRDLKRTEPTSESDGDSET